MRNKNSKKRCGPRLLLQLFLVTFKIGLVTFGGGMAMISIIQNEFSEKRPWVTGEDISDIAALSQTLPGMVALNASLLTGYRVGGALAAITAGVGCILPSFIVLCAVTVFYSEFVTNAFVRGALRGVSGAVVALFVSTLVKLARKNVGDLWGLGFFAAALALILIFPSLNVIYIILGGGALGFVLYYLILGRKGALSD